MGFPRYHPYWSLASDPLNDQRLFCEEKQRLASGITPELRPKLLRHKMSVPLGSSRGNFNQFLPSRGFSQRPSLPVGV